MANISPSCDRAISGLVVPVNICSSRIVYRIYGSVTSFRSPPTLTTCAEYDISSTRPRCLNSNMADG